MLNHLLLTAFSRKAPDSPGASHNRKGNYAMSRATMGASIRMGLTLDRIEVVLGKFGALPEVRLIGTVETPSAPRAGLQSEVTIVTRHLGRYGEAWINEMREAFDAGAPSQQG